MNEKIFLLWLTYISCFLWKITIVLKIIILIWPMEPLLSANKDERICSYKTLCYLWHEVILWQLALLYLNSLYFLITLILSSDVISFHLMMFGAFIYSAMSKWASTWLVNNDILDRLMLMQIWVIDNFEQERKRSELKLQSGEC